MGGWLPSLPPVSVFFEESVIEGESQKWLRQLFQKRFDQSCTAVDVVR